MALPEIRQQPGPVAFSEVRDLVSVGDLATRASIIASRPEQAALTVVCPKCAARRAVPTICGQSLGNRWAIVGQLFGSAKR
jgi:hypothetical protein